MINSKCPECSNDVDTQAAECPECGRTLRHVEPNPVFLALMIAIGGLYGAFTLWVGYRIISQLIQA